MADTPASGNILETKVDATSARFEKNMRAMADLVTAIRNDREAIHLGGGPKAIESQHAKGRLTARDLHALTPLFWTHVNPYGRFELDMRTRIASLT